ncbi:MAG: hypothetical protein OQK95_00815 [Gammaproteobacteria bacterium]|nr:hypothetical protein [Gammaproteobacteria bacterium]
MENEFNGGVVLKNKNKAQQESGVGSKNKGSFGCLFYLIYLDKTQSAFMLAK